MMNHYEGDNLGSLQKIEFAFHTDFESFNPAVLKAGKTWKNIPFKEQSGNLSASGADSDNGNVFSYEGKFFVNRIREEVRKEIHPFLGQHAVARVTDLNDEIYIIGAPGIPVTLSVDASTGANYTSENGSAFVFAIDQAFEYLKA